MGYQPIENYGLIGDMHTAALVGMDGSIDWFCFPHFDSPSVFAAILDDRIGGRFKIAPADPTANMQPRQSYWPDTNILVTRFYSPDGVGEVTDYMPVEPAWEGHGSHQLVRRVRVVRGTMAFRMECRPAFNYARDEHQTHLLPGGVRFESPSLALGLATSVPLRRDGNGVTAAFTLREEESVTFLLQDTAEEPGCGAGLTEEAATALFKKTVDYWRRWLSKCTYSGRWREMVHRSALLLKLMTFQPTGAIVAAPTCSLPEVVGGGRNWDYRYTWIRDAAFTLYALMRIGLTEEATAFMGWVEARCKELNPDGSLQIMYGIDGRHHLTEEHLGHLEGYRGSRPVRIGNDAYNHLQLDIYGELMDSVYLYNKYGAPISYDFWQSLCRLMDYLGKNWDQPDEGIWEVRSGRRHFVYSKLMCWVAFDRAHRLSEKRSFPADRLRWLSCRDTIYQEIMTRGWDEKRETFVQYYGGHSLDAATLMMPLVFFTSPDDPRMRKTLDAVLKSPDEGGLVSNSLVYRYNVRDLPDGFDDIEGTFNICTFWLVEAMARAGRFDPQKRDSARLIFEQMLGYANHLGLYAEETGPVGEALGNFPQAFTHLALISAAFNLDRALGSADRA
ncbi:MAG: glycoside hydrolase family 15 protein [Candidatus Manganitrophus sp. SB1]|nr:glycoside hydrolase family 15 protein [Candidatus Manganitrophus morganii]